MRESLKQSIDESPVTGFERYPKGSIVLCNACALPIFKLERGIDLGQRAGGLASAFKPLSLADLVEIAGRTDIDAGIRAKVAQMAAAQQLPAFLSQLREMRSGDAMVCPVCQDCFVQVLSRTPAEVHDRAYVLELLTIPPYGAGRMAPVRGLRLDAEHGDWLHEPRRNH